MTPEMDLPLDNPNPHVQVYAVLNAAVGEYELVGPGYLSILTDEVEGSTVHYLETKNKQSETIMLSRLRFENNYEKQKGSVIAWRDSDQKLHSDLALSFSDENECDFIWRLICEKIGKNYLQISGRGQLEMPREDNLAYILDQTRTSKDMVEYHILNSHNFIEALAGLFATFEAADDAMGMGMIARIIKSVLTNVDHRLVQKLFSDPSFQLLLQVQKFNCGVDFLTLCKASTRLRQIVPLPTQIAKKVELIHRITFYRQNVLDLSKETYFEHILMMTQTECYRELIIYLSKGDTFPQLLHFCPTNEPNLDSQNGVSEAKDEITQELKLQFLMQSLMLLKQVQSDNIKRKLIERMHESDVQGLALEALELNRAKAIDFYTCLAQANPHSFLNLLAKPHPFTEGQNLIGILAKKYCDSTNDLRSNIMEIFKMLSEPFRGKEQIQLLKNEFIRPVVSKCSQGRALLLIISELQNTLDCSNALFEAVLEHHCFHKFTLYLQQNARVKDSELRAVKLLKRLLVQNALNMRNTTANRPQTGRLSPSLLERLNEEAIKSGFFECCIRVLGKYLHLNNVISSSMLENLKIISDFKRFTPYQQFLQEHKDELSQIYQHKDVHILFIKIKEASPQSVTKRTLIPEIHKANLQEELQEEYLMQDADDPKELARNQSNSLKEESCLEMDRQMASLKALTQQIAQQSQEEDQDLDMMGSGVARKRRKENERTAPEPTIELKLDFDEEGNE